MARCPSSGSDVDNEEAEESANVAIADGHADICASAVMTDDNDDDADEGNFDDTLSEILGASNRVSTSLDLDLAFGRDCRLQRRPRLHSTSLSTLPPPPSPRLSSSFCCCWGAYLRSRSFHYHNQLVVVL